MDDMADENPSHLDHGRMAEFIERRREDQARARRERIQLVAITVLGLIAIVLTVSNAVLVSRLIARPARPPAAAPLAPRPAAPPDEPPPPVSQEPEPAPAPAPAAAPRLWDDAGVPPRRSPPAPETRTPPPSRPSRTPRAEERTSLPSRPPRDPAERTARYLVQTYGPLEAETRALAVTQFYSSPEEAAFWRRVLAHVRAAER
jgi:hypothetical protein